MENKLISTFKERPQTRLAWWALGLGISTVLISPLVGIFSTLLRTLLDPASVNPNRSMAGGMGGVVLSLLFAISALMAGITALKRGERSWVVWTGFMLALLAGAFWIFIIVVQFASPD